VKKIILTLIVIGSLLHLALPAMAMYHEVYKWDGLNWVLVTDDKATMFSEKEDNQQYRFFPSGTPGSSVYLSPQTGNPCQFSIENEVKLHFSSTHNPEVWFSETELIWDIFKPGCFMGKAFIIGIKSHYPVQILFGSGTIQIPDSSDPATGTTDWTIPHSEEYMVEDMERKGSLLNKNQEGTPPDTININYWWYEADEIPALHIWDSATEPVPEQDNVGPNPDQWKQASDMNGRVIIIRDIDVWKYLVFFENLKVESSASEGKYFEQFSITVAPAI